MPSVQRYGCVSKPLGKCLRVSANRRHRRGAGGRADIAQFLAEVRGQVWRSAIPFSDALVWVWDTRTCALHRSVPDGNRPVACSNRSGRENRLQGEVGSAIAPRSFGEAGCEKPQQRDIEAIEPDDRLVAEIAVVMPGP